MSNAINDQTITLAGLSQAAFLVQQLARRGRCDDAALSACVRSLFCRDPEHPIDAYGDFKNLEIGLQKLEAQLGGSDSIDPEQARYAAAMMVLQKKLGDAPSIVSKLGDGLSAINLSVDEDGLVDEATLGGIADLYQITLSQLRPRVMVNGEQNYLNQTVVTNRIRSLLMSGVRAAYLWRQFGGRHWILLFRRGAILNETRRILHDTARRRT